MYIQNHGVWLDGPQPFQAFFGPQPVIVQVCFLQIRRVEAAQFPPSLQGIFKITWVV